MVVLAQENGLRSGFAIIVGQTTELDAATAAAATETLLQSVACNCSHSFVTHLATGASFEQLDSGHKRASCSPA